MNKNEGIHIGGDICTLMCRKAYLLSIELVQHFQNIKHISEGLDLIGVQIEQKTEI